MLIELNWLWVAMGMSLWVGTLCGQRHARAELREKDEEIDWLLLQVRHKVLRGHEPVGTVPDSLRGRLTSWQELRERLKRDVSEDKDGRWVDPPDEWRR